MTTALRLPVEIDTKIRARPDLLESVERATEYFESQYQELPQYHSPKPIQFTWSLDGTGHAENVCARFDEEYDGVKSSARQPIPSRWMNDPMSRNISMLRLIRRVIETRSDRNSIRMDRLIRELEEEELNHGG